MPSKSTLFHSHKNISRSEISVNSQEERDADNPHSTTSDHHLDEGLPYRSQEAGFYQLASVPTRPQSQLSSGPAGSQSHRLPTLLNTTDQPSISLHSTPSSAVEDDSPDRYYQQTPRVPVHKAEQKKRRFFGLGSSSKEVRQDKLEKVGRSTSVRRKDQSQQPESHNTDARNRTEQQRWSALKPLDDGEELESGAALRTSYARYTASEKDPLRSPGFPPPLTHEEYLYGRSTQQAIVSDSATRQPLERQSSSQSPKTARQQPSSYHPSPSSATSTSSHPFAYRGQHEALQQLYQEQNSRPSSAQSLEPPPIVQYPRASDSHPNQQEQSQVSPGAYMQGSMGPPQTQQAPPTRRSSEATQQSSSSGGQGREGGNYQHYNQGVQQGPNLPSNAPPQYSAQLAPQGQSYRGSAQPLMTQQDGRSTPPPNRSRDDLSGLDVAQLLNRHDELQDKYRKVKKYYFDKDAQVQQLQNTLAHQRLSQSRTSLDDNEYSNRFQRLDGAINNLAFNIRRDWRSVPPWLAPHVNRDAATQPTKEMTAVGRACISRWLVDELLERYFHPSLEPGFSAQLKIIEKNLRRFAAPTPSEEEKDSLLARISNWRLATLDGLQEVLSSSQAAENRASLTESLVEKLTASLSMMLKEPSPPGLEGGVSMIVELAVGIAANLPLESRDVFVEYVAPGVFVQEAWMKVETGLPALTSPGEGPTEADGGSIVSKQTEETGSIDSRDTGTSTGNGSEETAKEMAMQQQAQQQQAVQGKKKGMFTGFMGGAGGKKGSVSGASPGPQPQQGQGQVQQQASPPKEDRVRFSTFMAVEVRGRSVLMKAPVYVRE